MVSVDVKHRVYLLTYLPTPACSVLHTGRGNHHPQRREPGLVLSGLHGDFPSLPAPGGPPGEPPAQERAGRTQVRAPQGLRPRQPAAQKPRDRLLPGQDRAGRQQKTQAALAVRAVNNDKDGGGGGGVGGGGG